MMSNSTTPKIASNIGKPIVLRPDVLKRAQQIEVDWQKEREQMKSDEQPTSYYRCIDR